MANFLPSASMSPQIVNGVVEWYQNDCFTYSIQISLVNPETQESVLIQETDSVQTTFYHRGALVYTFQIKGADLVLSEDGKSQTMKLNFTEDVSKKFVVQSQDLQNKFSKYIYCIKLLTSDGIHTIGANLEAKVKVCH